MQVRINGDHIEIRTCEGVYPPSEDSFLLLDSIPKSEIRGKRVLDLGTGTGIIGIACAKFGGKVTVVDVKEEAVRCAMFNAELNGVNIRALLGDLFEPVVGEIFDFIFFNPPYLPADSETDIYLRDEDKLDLIGGEKGVEVSIRFIEELPSHLSDNGRAFLLVSSLSDVNALYESLRSKRLSFMKRAGKRFEFEELFVLEIKK